MLFPIAIPSQVMWQIFNTSNKKWFYQDGDEFNAPQLNETDWRLGLPWGNFTMSQDLYFANENVYQKDGKVVFVAKKEKRKFHITEGEIDKNYLKKSGKKVEDNQFEVDYTCGLITSKRKYKYGMFEARFKSTDNKGIWPAFWLYGGEPNEEIDFFELKGERENQMHVDVHCPNGCEDYKGGFLNLQKNWGAWVPANANLANDWNIVSGEWQDGYVKFYINGEPMAYFKGDFKTFQYLILNTSVAKTGGPFSPGPDESTKWPNEFMVDYVRVWSGEDSIPSKKNNFNRFGQTPQTIENNNLYSTDLKKKVKYVYNNKELKDDCGTITLLPVSAGKYSLSIVGKNLGQIKFKVLNSKNENLVDGTIDNTKYYLLDLSKLNGNENSIELEVKGQTLKHNLR